ncbi:MAG: ABC-F family ATP-binding cassette domain-containing protein [Chloroflexota bacterium]
MNIISLESISKQFVERPLLRDITFGITAGERVGVVGLNGSGKTTLLKIVAGVEEADSGRVSRVRDLRVAYLSQNPQLDPELTVIEQVFQGDAPQMQLLRTYEQAAAALARQPNDAALQEQVTQLVNDMDAADAWSLEQEARTILSRLGIMELDARVGTLSGGQRKRVAMAASLIFPADFLILDEPTNHIDTETVAWLEGFLSRTTSALLLVTHDRYFLDRVINRIVEVDRGSVYSYPGNYQRFLEQKAERAAQQVNAESRRQTILKKEMVWLRRGAQARTTKQQARIDRINEMQAATPENQRGDIEISVEARRLGKKIVELQGISHYFDDRCLIDKLDLSIAKRERLGIVGPNGSGKTTLLNLIAERLTPTSGTIDIGETVHIAYYDQESVALDESQRVIDYVKEGAEMARTGEGSLVSAAQMLERFLFPSDSHYTRIEKLSGGERRRLYLLRVLMSAPNVLLLDEPTNDLDIQTLTVLEDYLDDFAGALITVSHDRYFLDRTAEHLLAFEGNGRIVSYAGSYSYYAEVLTSQVAARQSEKPGKERQDTNKNQDRSTKPRKLTFKEQRELGELEQRIANLESRQVDLEARIAAASDDYQQLMELTTELEQVGTDLEAAMERWAELAEIAEQS